MHVRHLAAAAALAPLAPLASLALGACAHPAPSTSVPPLVVVTPTEPRELLPEQQVQQVLNRLALGPRPGDAARVRAMGVDKWIALQLAPERIDDRATDELVAQHYPTLAMPTSEVVQIYDQARQAQVQRQRQLAAQGDTMARRDARQELRQDPDVAMKMREAQQTFAQLQSAKVARAVTSER